MARFTERQIPCTRCGVEITTRCKMNRVYCDGCRQIVKQENWVARYARDKEALKLSRINKAKLKPAQVKISRRTDEDVLMSGSACQYCERLAECRRAIAENAPLYEYCEPLPTTFPVGVAYVESEFDKLSLSGGVW
jgi:hypothetical protein